MWTPSKAPSSRTRTTAWWWSCARGGAPRAADSEGVRCSLTHARAPRARSGLAIADGGRTHAPGELGEGAPQVSLFSGLVGSDAMQAAFKKVSATGALRFGGAPRAERVVMAGPGGRGRVEVAVTEPQQQPEVRAGHAALSQAVCAYLPATSLRTGR
jgi:hypothetical protein